MPKKSAPKTVEQMHVAIDSVHPHPKNPRRGDVAAIQESLELNGQYRPIVVQKSTGFILAGNHTHQAAQALEWPTIAASFVDVDDVTAERILLADNRLGDVATYDNAALLEVLEDLADTDEALAGTGWSPEAFEEVVKAVAVDRVRDGQEERPARVENPVIGYSIVFEDEDQQTAWHAFLRWLRDRYPDAETVAARLVIFAQRAMDEDS